jgi:hypothetical protein
MQVYQNKPFKLLVLCAFGISVWHSTQGAKGSRDTSNSDEHQNCRSYCCDTSPFQRSEIDGVMKLFVLFGFGGLALGFLPLYICFFVPLRVYNNRIFRASAFGLSAIGAVSASGGVLWLNFWALPVHHCT